MLKRSVREKIYKYKWIHRALACLLHNRGMLFCKVIAKKNHYHSRLLEIKEKKGGNRCFIIGNGPSLTIEDLEMIKDEDCMASNGIFNVFERTTWRPKYYFLSDRYADYSPELIRDLDVKYIFLGSYYWLHNTVIRNDAFCIRERMFFNKKEYKFSNNIEKYFVNSGTVSYFAMQTAAYLGYKEIYLLGFDNAYQYEKLEDGSVVNTGLKGAHFYKDQIPREIVGEPIEMEKSYESFKRYADKNGISVKNATRGGKLEVFERTNLEEIIRS